MEIAEEIGISRQGVRGLIKKAEGELFFYEEKLGLAKKLLSVESAVNSLSQLAKEQALSPEIQQEILRLAQAVKE